MPEELREGDIFVADDGSRFKFDKIDVLTSRKYLTCMNCKLKLDDLDYIDHLNSSVHFHNL